MPATLHVYVPLHLYCSLHINSPLLYTSINNQVTATFIYHSIAKYVPPKICTSNATNMPYAQITLHAFVGKYANICVTYDAVPTKM